MGLTEHELAIIGHAIVTLQSSTYQPQEDDLAVAQSLIERGMIEMEPGFATIRATRAGMDAYYSDSRISAKMTSEEDYRIAYRLDS